MEKNKFRQLVVKGNDFVEKACFQISINEQRLLNRLIAVINPREDEIFQLHEFNLSDVYEWLRLKRKTKVKQREILKKVLKSLQTKIIEIVIAHPEHGGEVLIMPAFSFIKTPVIDWDKGLIYLKIVDDLQPHLMRLSRFTKCFLDELDSFKCEYSARLLELCVNKSPRADFHTGIIDGHYIQREYLDITWLRKHLGIDDKKYSRISNFNQKVLKPSHREINTNTSSRFDYKMIKKGRAVVGVEFIIHGSKVGSENPKPYALPDFSGREMKLLGRMKAFGVSSHFREALLLSNLDLRRLETALNAAEEWGLIKNKRGEVINYPSRVLEKALLAGWMSKADFLRQEAAREQSLQDDKQNAERLMKENMRRWEVEKDRRIDEDSDKSMAEYESVKERARAVFESAVDVNEKMRAVFDLLPEDSIASFNDVEILEMKSFLMDAILDETKIQEIRESHRRMGCEVDDATDFDIIHSESIALMLKLSAD